jgi:hypothetical protein
MRHKTTEVKLSNARSVFVRVGRGDYEIALPDHRNEGFYLRHVRGIMPDELRALAECIKQALEESSEQ